MQKPWLPCYTKAELPKWCTMARWHATQMAYTGAEKLIPRYLLLGSWRGEAAPGQLKPISWRYYTDTITFYEGCDLKLLEKHWPEQRFFQFLFLVFFLLCIKFLELLVQRKSYNEAKH